MSTNLAGAMTARDFLGIFGPGFGPAMPIYFCKDEDIYFPSLTMLIDSDFSVILY